MKPPFSSPTATWHNDTYPAIDPKNPQLSQAGRTVIITGAGSGIGRATSLAFAQAGAKHIVLIGRTESKLRETEALAASSSSAVVTTFACSVTDEAAIRNVASTVGAWDVLILNAAHLTVHGPIAQASLEQFWLSYETNVKSLIVAAQAFFPNANKGAAVLSVGAAGSILPATLSDGVASYMTSKVAQAKVVEHLAKEYPELFICSVHPGIVDTAMLKTAGLDGGKLPEDTGMSSPSPFLNSSAMACLVGDLVELPAHFLVWLVQPKTKFLGGRMVWANWDVEELCERAEEIRKRDLLTVGLVGWPFAPSE